MKYIVCKEPGTFLLEETNVPVRKAGEALLKITKVGICGTDLHAFQGNQSFFTYPRILGHELAAEIIEIDENEQGLKTGDHVIIMPYLSCGTCVACRNGKTNCCTDIAVLGVHTDGGMQEIISLPTDILIAAGTLTDKEIAIVEPLAIGAHSLRRAEIKKGESVLVIGCGPIGFGIIKLAQVAGANVIAMDVNNQRLEFAKEAFGVEHLVNAIDNPLETLLACNNNELPTVVIDATGNKKALESGVNYMAHGGKYVLVGHHKGELTFNHPFIHSKETTLMCSRNATMEDMLKVKEVLESGAFPTDAYVTHEVPFEEMIENFDSWLKPETGVVKAMLTL
ncbi:zinc-binding alcohol dehydrogenase family protein [Aurantibacter crassamenti]|uniref:zinc-binding alcohol dehydrogenase family protein n=1 Tax=Aurantibacter crassamenti TaxID=1837375 RepID=UPI0019399875|nr:zinc-binding alcohol dehydrogenase family protein [Aurantibacter crassamenti]MBM1105710.1 zinc-binding alcohol dehydrogenase family protein [Aurantibacter crassamenti]